MSVSTERLDRYRRVLERHMNYIRQLNEKIAMYNRLERLREIARRERLRKLRNWYIRNRARLRRMQEAQRRVVEAYRKVVEAMPRPPEFLYKPVEELGEFIQVSQANYARATQRYVEMVERQMQVMDQMDNMAIPRPPEPVTRGYTSLGIFISKSLSKPRYVRPDIDPDKYFTESIDVWRGLYERRRMINIAGTQPPESIQPQKLDINRFTENLEEIRARYREMQMTSFARGNRWEDIMRRYQIEFSEDIQDIRRMYTANVMRQFRDRPVKPTGPPVPAKEPEFRFYIDENQEAYSFLRGLEIETAEEVKRKVEMTLKMQAQARHRGLEIQATNIIDREKYRRKSPVEGALDWIQKNIVERVEGAVQMAQRYLYSLPTIQETTGIKVYAPGFQGLQELSNPEFEKSARAGFIEGFTAIARPWTWPSIITGTYEFISNPQQVTKWGPGEWGYFLGTVGGGLLSGVIVEKAIPKMARLRRLREVEVAPDEIRVRRVDIKYIPEEVAKIMREEYVPGHGLIGITEDVGIAAAERLAIANLDELIRRGRLKPAEEYRGVRIPRYSREIIEYGMPEEIKLKYGELSEYIRPGQRVSIETPYRMEVKGSFRYTQPERFGRRWGGLTTEQLAQKGLLEKAITISEATVVEGPMKTPLIPVVRRPKTKLDGLKPEDKKIFHPKDIEPEVPSQLRRTLDTEPISTVDLEEVLPVEPSIVKDMVEKPLKQDRELINLDKPVQRPKPEALEEFKPPETEVTQPLRSKPSVAGPKPYKTVLPKIDVPRPRITKPKIQVEGFNIETSLFDVDLGLALGIQVETGLPSRPAPQELLPRYTPKIAPRRGRAYILGLSLEIKPRAKKKVVEGVRPANILESPWPRMPRGGWSYPAIKIPKPKISIDRPKKRRKSRKGYREFINPFNL